MASQKGGSNWRGRTRSRVAIAVAAMLLASSCAGRVGKLAREDGAAQSPQSALEELGATDGDVTVDDLSPGSPTAESVVDESDGVGVEGTPDATQSSIAGQRGQPSVASGPAGAAYGGDAGVTNDTITIGYFVPASGPGGQISKPAMDSFRAAADEVNDAGGIHGRKIVVKVFDDSGGPSAVQAQARDAIQSKQIFMFATPINTDAAILVELGDEYQVPVVVGNLSDSIAKPSTWGFSVFPYWYDQARDLMPSYLVKSLDGASKKIGVIYDTTENGARGADGFKEGARSAGLDVVVVQPIDSNPSTCVNEVSKLQAAGAEIVLMLSLPLSAICILRDARSLGYNPIFTGLNSSWGFNVVTSGSGGATEGMTVFGANGTNESAAGQHYQRIMNKYYPESNNPATNDIGIGPFGIAYYVLEALRRAGPEITRNNYLTVLEEGMEGWMGPNGGYTPPAIRYAPGNHASPPAVTVQKVVNGEWVTITKDPLWRTSF